MDISNEHKPVAVPSRKLQSSLPLQIPRSPCRQFANSQPDVAADIDFWMCNHFLTCTATSLSFRNLYIDGERTIILHEQDVESEVDEELEPGAGHPSRKHATSEDETDRDEPGNYVKGEGSLKPPSLTDISLFDVISASCQQAEAETQEFFSKEMSEYLVIKEGSDDVASDDSGRKSVSNDDDDTFLVLELPLDDTQQSDDGCSPHSTKCQTLLSTTQFENTSSLDKREEMEFIRSQSDESLASQISQSSSGRLHVFFF